MIRRLIILLLIVGCVCYGTVINVPADYITIQEGIDAALEGDIVVVYPDTYYENITVDKTITLTSLALFDTTTNTLKDALETWFSDDYPIVVTDDYINTTIIDGSTSNNRSPVIIDGNGGCISPTVQGFTIQGGNGTEVDRYYEDPEGEVLEVKQHLGGGIFIYKSNPKIYYNKIQNNGHESDVETGGAIYASSDTEDCDWSTRRSKVDEECDNDSFDFRYNFFENNYSKLGMHLSNRKFDGEFNLSGSVFDYWNCQNPEYQTKCWINIDEIEDLTADDYHSNSCLRSVPTYVDPNTGNDDLNTGSIDSPFKTIGKAIISVAGSELAPVTIHLAEGTYSPSTNGETFPIIMINHINLIGQGEEVTIIDAEQTEQGFYIFRSNNIILSNFNITGGYAQTITPSNTEPCGGGIYIINSDNIMITDIIISSNISHFGGGIFIFASHGELTNGKIINNIAESGGGIFINERSDFVLTDIFINGNESNSCGGIVILSDAILNNVEISNNISTESGSGGIKIINSTPILTNVKVENNMASFSGGGMGLFNANPIMSHVTIIGNMADDLTNANLGGGMYLFNSHPTLTHVTIANNTAGSSGGGMSLNSSNPIMNNVTIANNTAGGSGGGMSLNSSNPIMNNVTIANNTAGSLGGGIFIASSNPTLTNSIIWGNILESIYLGSGTPLITYSDIDGGWEGEENIDTDPLFNDPENGDFTLQEGSACIDVGIIIEGMEYCGEAPDMGAFEYITEDCLGCTDETACNYDEIVMQDNGSCEYPEEFYDCDNNCIAEIDCNDECGGTAQVDDCGICGGSNECLSLNELIIPDHYSISSIYPNPFNPITSITYGLPENGDVKLNVYNIQGRQIETLVNTFQTAGYYSVSWNANNLPSGVYLIRMDSGDFTQTQKVVLVK